MTSGWQPIETAPKDATEILVLHEKNGSRNILVAHWAQGGGEDQPPYQGWFYFTGYDFCALSFAPKLWAPIPADLRKPR